MFPHASGIVIQGGRFININNIPSNRTFRGMDLLMEWVATGAFHNSDELYDAPKCHPHTRVAVLDDIMQWINESSEFVRDNFILWLFGPAGSGKSAIAKKIAEIATEKDLLIAGFFFSRTSPTRNTKDRLIATLAYQLTVSIPGTRCYIEDAIERDPAIFKKNVQTQIETLLIKPFHSILSTQIPPRQKLIIIDGLDECNDSQNQGAILEAISLSFTEHKLPIIFLVASRPETDLVTSFNCSEPLRSIHRRLSLDDTYRPDDDIRLFFSDTFEQIRRTHPLRSTIPSPWPSQELLDILVKKSSGQFIYASTVVKFVKSSRHRPSACLEIILGISPPGLLTPFAELDALYSHILSSVDNIQLTLRVLGFYVMTPTLASRLRISMSPELFLSLESGDIQVALLNLPSIVTYHESSREVDILHASFADFLSDKCRSTTFYIDMGNTCLDFVRRILKYVKGPDGIRAGDIDLFREVIELSPWIPKGQLQSDILNFDLDAFIAASIKRYYMRSKVNRYLISGSTIEAFDVWKRFLDDAGLDDGDKKKALNRLHKSFESRFKIYLSNWRLQLLLTLAVPDNMHFGYYRVPSHRCLDILLEMDANSGDLHLVDPHTLDLRQVYTIYGSRLIGMISPYLDGDTYASAALHCMRFLSNPPKYYESHACPEMGVIHVEWKATCDMTLKMLSRFLRQANTSPELVKFIRNHVIHPGVQKCFSRDRVAEVNADILEFLRRANVYINWGIISAIKRSLVSRYK